MTLATMDEEELPKVTITDSIPANNNRGTYTHDSILLILFEKKIREALKGIIGKILRKLG